MRCLPTWEEVLPLCKLDNAIAACNMSITVEVGLLSGKTATVRVGVDERVATLKGRAQSTLRVGEGQLLDSSGSRMHAHTLIKDANLKRFCCHQG